MAAFWRSDSAADSTLLLQHLRQIRDQKSLVQAASAFVCQLIAEACSHGKQPAISLHSLLLEVNALHFYLAISRKDALYSTALCSTVPYLTLLHCTVLLYWTAAELHCDTWTSAITSHGTSRCPNAWN